MAVDQALLERAADGIPALRLYGWAVPTLSLGYFQAWADRERHPPSVACPAVRRWSGGGAIVHDAELTYSLVVPQAQRWGPAAERLYPLIHGTLIDALAGCGVTARSWTPARALEGPSDVEGGVPFLCFQRRSEGDLVIGPHKVVGSAQRRLRGAVLQHGSILWRRSPCAPELPGIADLSEWDAERAEEARGQFTADWLALLARTLGVRWEPAELGDELRHVAARIETDRFGSPAWTEKR
ncbi:MAG: lipoate--protein ligase family protein [Pirellulales bacterium]